MKKIVFIFCTLLIACIMISMQDSDSCQKPRGTYNLFNLKVDSLATFIAYANQSSNYTHINLQKGNIYSFNVSSNQKWTDGKYFRSFRDIPAGGKKENLAIKILKKKLKVPYAPWFSLIGSINEDYFFLIDTAKKYSPSSDGELICFANDWPSRYCNNSGSITFTIRRIK